MRKMNQATPKFWRLVPKFRAPRYPGPRSASRSRRGPRFTLKPLTAGADASASAQATGPRHVSATTRRAEIRLTVLE